MIYAKLNRLDRYRGLGANLDRTIDFLQGEDLSALPLGTTHIDGEKVYVNRFDYVTAGQSLIEAHLRYVDVHVVLEGQEQIGVADVADLRENDRKEDEDFIGFEGSFRCMCKLSSGDALIVFPEDAHSPKLIWDHAGPVKKAVFKVLV